MASTLQTIYEQLGRLCGKDESAKEVAWKFCTSLEHVLVKYQLCMPRSADIICAFIASESVHVGPADKVLTYKQALEHFGKHSEVEFWKAVSDMEHLLELASKDTSVEPRLYFTRLPTFDIPCEQCSVNGIPCYKVSSEPGKRSTKKCIPCFNHHNRPCGAEIEMNNGDDALWSPPKRTLQQKIKSIEDRGSQTALKKHSTRTSKHSSPILPWVRSTELSSHAQRAESSQMARRRMVSQGTVGTLAAQEHARIAPTSQARPTPLIPANKSDAASKTPSKGSRVAITCRPKMDVEPTRDPRKRVQSTTIAPSTSSALAPTSQLSGNLPPVPSLSVSMPNRPPATTAQSGPSGNPSKTHASISAPLKPPPPPSTSQKRRKSLPSHAGDTAGRSLVSTPQSTKRESISSSSGSGNRTKSMTSPSATQSQRFVTPEISFRGAESYRAGQQTARLELEPLFVTSEQRFAERSSDNSLSLTHVRRSTVETSEEGSSPQGTKRASKISDDDSRKKQKVSVEASPTGKAKAAARTPRRKGSLGNISRDTIPTSPVDRLTPPQSRTASPAAAILPHHLPTLAPDAPPANLIASIDPPREEPELSLAAQVGIPRLPTPISPSHMNVDLPDFIQADLLAASESKPEFNADQSMPSSAPPAPSPRGPAPPASSSSSTPSHGPTPFISHAPLTHDPSPAHAAQEPSSSTLHTSLLVFDTTARQDVSMESEDIPGPSTLENEASASSVSQPVIYNNPVPAITPAVSRPASDAVSVVQPTQIPTHPSPNHVPPPVASASVFAPAPPPVPDPAPPSQHAQFVELVYQKAKEIVEYLPEVETARLQLRFAVSDMRLRLEKIDKLQDRGSEFSGKPLMVLRKLLLAAGKKVVSQMQEAQRVGEMDDIVLETMIEELSERLDEMKKIPS